MKKFTISFKWKGFHLTILVLAVLSGVFLFQGQNMDSQFNPNIDQVPKYMLRYGVVPRQPFIPPPPVTVGGYDNWNLGNDFAEVMMSNNPRNIYWFFNAFNTNGGHYTLDAWTWTNVTPPFPNTAGDPWTAYDSLGNLYYITLNSSVTGTWVQKSTNGGATWGTAVAGVTGGDRCNIAADQTAGPYAGYVYCGETSSSFSSANFARSTNGGASFTQTATLTPHNLPGFMCTVGPNGSIQGGCVYAVTYSGANSAGTYNFHRSTDGGATFTFMSSISGIGIIGIEISSRSTINGARTRPYPMIAADNSYGPYRGRLYVVWANNDPPGNGNKPDVWLKYSTDQGATWSTQTIVNDNPNPQASDQWFPAVWCEKETGKLYIKWYDDRSNPGTYQTDVYATYSTNGGVSFATSQRVTNQTFTYPGLGCGAPCYMGDYDAMAASTWGGLAAWFDPRNFSYGSYVGYFPDFAMTVIPSVIALNSQNDSSFSYVSVPGVKLFTNKVHFTSVVSPPPANGTITVSFLNRTNSTLQDTLTTYPDSIRVRVRTSGGVTPGTYTITITGVGRIGGTDGTPIHKRDITLTTFTGIEPITNEIPSKFYLYQNYPNPFNPTTNIRFDLAKAGHVKLTVFDITGKLVEFLADKDFNAGSFNADFKADNLSSGIYFYRLETSEFTAIRKMILIK